MLDDAYAIAERAWRVVGMTKDNKTCLLGFVGGDCIGASIPIIILGEPRQVGFVQKPSPHHLACQSLMRLQAIAVGRRDGRTVEDREHPGFSHAMPSAHFPTRQSRSHRD